MSYKRKSPMPVTEGGTGAQTLTGVLTGNGTSAITANAVTQYNVLVGGASNAVSSITNGTTGQIFTANTGANPGWAAAPSSGIVTIDGNSGSATGSTVTIATSNSTIKTSGSGATMTMNMQGDSSSNILIGTSGTISSGARNVTLGVNSGVGITQGTNNVAIGHSAMQAGTVTGSNNTAIGFNSCLALTSGAGNTAVGAYSMQAATITGNYNTACGDSALKNITSDTGNCALGLNAGVNLSGSTGYNTLAGYSSGSALVTGNYNALYGYSSGNSYTSSESSNICINASGTAAESHVLRIGAGTGTSTQQLNSAYISGIRGITSASSDQLLAVNSSNQIASIGAGTAGQVLTSNGAGNAPSFQAASSAGSLVLLATVTASGGASVSFSSTYITATYNTYLLNFSNVQPASNNDILLMQISTNNGSTYISTGYQSGQNQWIYNSATLSNGNSTSYLFLTPGVGSANFASGQAWLSNMQNGASFLAWGNSSVFYNSASAYGANMISYNAATSVNNIKIYCLSGGNITTGTFNLYGLVGS
jgi:hypothetical protein